MPRAAYIILARFGAIDEAANTISFFNVIEAIRVKLIPENAASIPVMERPPMQQYRLVATWLREEGDSIEQEFETKMTCTMPNGGIIFEAQTGPFRFTAPFHRIYVNDISFPGFPALGVYEIKASVRQIGQEVWTALQAFPFLVMDEPAPSTNP